MHYKLFLPGVSGANPKHLETFGLSSLGDTMPSIVDVRAFQPGGNARGVILIWGPLPAGDFYSFDWRWERAGEYWIGIDPENRPTPEDLLRKKSYPGNWMELLDGKEWLIPAYTQFEHSFQLVDGEIARKPAPQWEAYISSMQSVTREIFTALDMLDVLAGKNRPESPSDEPVTVKIQDGLRVACEALAVNYRINPEIACMLGLLDDSTLVKLLALAIELPEIVAARAEKKNGFTAVIPVT